MIGRMQKSWGKFLLLNLSQHYGVLLRPGAGKFHNLADTKRLRIVLSSLILHGFWLDGYELDIEHVDWVTSPGASIQALIHMWYVNYKNENIPMDLLIIAGLNNVIKGENGDRYMERHGDAYHTIVSNSTPKLPKPPGGNQIMGFNQRVFT